MKKLLSHPQFPEIALGISFAIALISILTSLYFSNIAGYVPCDLCWFQRIMMYPQAVLFGIALWYRDFRVYHYSVPLLLIGAGVSIYHNILYYNANFIHPNQTFAPCGVSGISCTTRYIEFFGFVTIPLLSFLAFAGLLIAMLLLRYNQHHQK